MAVPLNLAIFGVGAMATLFASRLSQATGSTGDSTPLLARAKITLIGTWREQIEALRRDNLTVTELDGAESHHAIHATDNLSEVPPADIALILVKSHQTARAAQQAAQILRTNGLALTLQNGLGNWEKLAEAVSHDRAGLGTTSQAATLLSPGHVLHSGTGPTYLATVRGLEKQLSEVATLFNEAGLEAIVVENADSMIWGKLAVNAGINPLTALLEIPNRVLLEKHEYRKIMFAAVNEVVNLALAQTISLPFYDACAHVAEVCGATANNRSSMLQDIQRSAPTEIDAISGAVVRIGKRLGLPTPVNEFLLHQIKRKEAGCKFDARQLQSLNL